MADITQVDQPLFNIIKNRCKNLSYCPERIAQGKSLLELPKISQIISAVTNGIGVMPAFEGMLTSEEIEAVAYFVSTSSNK